MFASAPDKPSGRGLKINESAVKKCAVGHGIPVLQPEKLKNPEFLELFRKSRRDVEVSKQLSGQEQLWANKARENYARAQQLATEARGLAK